MSVQFKDVRRIVKVSLPSYPESEIELYDSLLFGEMNEVSKKGTDDAERGVMTLRFLIKSWNFVGEDRKPLEISVSSLNKFPVKDLTFLLEKVGDFFTPKNKKGKKS